MWKQTVLEPYNKYERKLQPLCCVCSHQRDGGIAFVAILIGHECGVIDEVAQALESLIVVVDRSVDEFLQVFETAFRLVSFFGAESGFESRVQNGGAYDVG